MKLLKCPICGNVLEMVEDHGVPLMCCGKKIDKLKRRFEDEIIKMSNLWKCCGNG